MNMENTVSPPKINVILTYSDIGLKGLLHSIVVKSYDVGKMLLSSRTMV